MNDVMVHLVNGVQEGSSARTKDIEIISFDAAMNKFRR